MPEDVCHQLLAVAWILHLFSLHFGFFIWKRMLLTLFSFPIKKPQKRCVCGRWFKEIPLRKWGSEHWRESKAGEPTRSVWSSHFPQGTVSTEHHVPQRQPPWDELVGLFKHHLFRPWLKAAEWPLVRSSSGNSSLLLWAGRAGPGSREYWQKYKSQTAYTTMQKHETGPLEAGMVIDSAQ